VSGYPPGMAASRSSGRMIVTTLDGRPLQRQGPVAGRPAGAAKTRRVSAWIVRSVMLATTAFALLDLSLLVSSAHH